MPEIEALNREVRRHATAVHANSELLEEILELVELLAKRVDALEQEKVFQGTYL